MTRILQDMKNAAMNGLCAVLLGAFTISSPQAFAQAYPAKPIRLVVPSAAAGGPDIFARLFAGRLAEALGQQIIIDNRGGAGGRIGMELVAKATPDGHTILIISASQTIGDAIYKVLNYNLVKDFSPISLLGTVPFILVANPALPATSVKELVALAKSRPGALKYGSSGSGTTLHLSAEIFRFMTGTEILHVPYKASAPVLTAALTGEVDLSFQPMSAALPMVKNGRLKALGVTSSRRSPQVPDVPAVAESVPGYEFIGWYGLLAPAETPPAILSRLNAESVRAVSAPALQERLTGLGVDSLGTSQKDFAQFIGEQLEKMRVAVKVSGANPED